MGRGFVFNCKKCGYEIEPHLGVGFLFPKIYKETIEAAKDGHYGKSVQEFLEDHPSGALNCEKVLLQCTECGEFETDKDLSMYVPKEKTKHKENGRWSVAFPFEGAAYVAPWDLDDYELVCRYEHQCKKCGARMSVITEEELEEKMGEFFCEEQQTEFACPKCREPLWNVGDLMWD